MDLRPSEVGGVEASAHGLASSTRLTGAGAAAKGARVDEIERRIVAHELALIEVVAHLDHEHIREGIRAIRAGFVIGISEEERVIRVAAIELLEDALRRFEPAATGLFLKSRGVG